METLDQFKFRMAGLDQVRKILVRYMMKGKFMNVHDFQPWVDGEYVRATLQIGGVNYHISATHSYMGCIATEVSSGRGNDLADGPFNEDTWNQILADIVSYGVAKSWGERKKNEKTPV